jgi:hypothetical protein
MFGSKQIQDEAINSFFHAEGGLHPVVQFSKFLASDSPVENGEDILGWSMLSSVSSRDTYMHHLYSKALNTHQRKVKIDLMSQLNHMMMVDEVFANFLDRPAHNLYHCRVIENGECMDKYIPTDFNCLRTLMQTFEDNCGKFSDYSRRYVKYLVRECEQPTMSIEESMSKINDACQH